MSLVEKSPVYLLAPRNSSSIHRDVSNRIITFLSKQYDVPLYWFDNSGSDLAGYFQQGGCQPGIYIGKKAQMSPICVFFHELGHWMAVKLGLWKAYHKKPSRMEKGIPKFDRRTALIAKRTGYRAECWVDRWATKELARWWPNMKFEANYLGNRMAAKWLLEKHLIPCYNASL